MIRVIVGFFLVYGSVSAMDNVSDNDLFNVTLVAVLGLTLMFFGIRKVK
jgi:hypothetical protein